VGSFFQIAVSPLKVLHRESEAFVRCEKSSQRMDEKLLSILSGPSPLILVLQRRSCAWGY
jgi:hypothetical protein